MLWQPDMHQFNTVLIQFIYNKMHAVFQSNRFALAWETVKLFNNISAYRIVVL